MTGGSITGNTAEDSAGEGYGGGVYVFGDYSQDIKGGEFELSGGSITGNKAERGGGVFVEYGYTGEGEPEPQTSGVFRLSGNPVISGNTLTDARRPATSAWIPARSSTSPAS